MILVSQIVHENDNVYNAAHDLHAISNQFITCSTAHTMKY